MHCGYLLAATLLCGCVADAPQSDRQVEAGAASPYMPELRRLRLTLRPELLPQFSRAPMAVSNSGQIVFAVGDPRADMLLTAIDSIGDLVRQFTRRGAGPNEMRSVGFVSFVGDSLTAVDNEQARLITFDEQLRPLSMQSIRFGSRALSATERGVISFIPRELGGPILELTPLTQYKSAEPVLEGEDTVISRIVATRGQFERDGPPFAVSEGQWVLGDGIRYELVFYDSIGDERARRTRILPDRTRSEAELTKDSARLSSALRFRGPDGKITEIAGVRERLAKLPSELLPHFDSHGLTGDSRGRVWVVGSLHDSTFIDVWKDTTFVGRRVLACSDPGSSVSPNGLYLALMCRAGDENSDADVELQLYKVEEPAAP